ncbi:MAG TPA: glycosyltransferase family 2 protein [Syntrophobacteria bacterium]|nr:glycosyltransferase family 2 protein [Syntrophobacteria bacterium]
MIPTYNRAHYLNNAIESALSQDYRDIEIVISDNGSIDGTRELVKKYQHDSRLRYYRSETNLGSNANYGNLLYKYAQGQYGKYLTDDDYLIDRQHISKAMQIIDKHGVKIVFSAAIAKFDQTDEELNSCLEVGEVVEREWWLRNLCKVRKGVTVFPSCMSGVVFEIERAKNLNAFGKGQYYCDYDFAIKCILMDEKVGYINTASYVERQHRGQEGRTSFDYARNGARIFDNVYEFGRQLGIADAPLRRLRRRGLKFFARGYLVQNWINENGNSFRSLWDFLKELRALDRMLPVVALTDAHTMVKFAFRNSVLYGMLRGTYLRLYHRKR